MILVKPSEESFERERKKEERKRDSHRLGIK